MRVFDFFRENFIVHVSGNSISLDSDLVVNPSDSRLLDNVRREPILQTVLLNLNTHDVSCFSRSSDSDFSRDSFFVSATCPEYMLPAMMNLFVQQDYKMPKKDELFRNNDFYHLPGTAFFHRRIFDFKLPSPGTSRNKTPFAEVEQAKNEFLDLFPATIRGSLARYVDTMFYGSDTPVERRTHFSFDKFFKRLAIFTVFNEFLAHKDDSTSVTFEDFIRTDNVEQSLYERFHAGYHSVHDETVNLLHSIFSTPHNFFSTGTIDETLWRFFITQIADENTCEQSFHKLLNSKIGNSESSNEKTAAHSVKKTMINGLMNTTQDAISSMVEHEQGKYENNRVLNKDPMTNLIFNVNKDIYSDVLSASSLAEIYETTVIRQWGFDLEQLEDINNTPAYQIALKAAKKSQNANIRNIIRRRQSRDDFSPLGLKIYASVFNMLIHTAQQTELEEIDVWRSKDHIEFDTMAQSIFNSDLLEEENFNLSHNRIVSFGKAYLENRNTMPIELILGVCGINIVQEFEKMTTSP